MVTIKVLIRQSKIGKKKKKSQGNLYTTSNTDLLSAM